MKIGEKIPSLKQIMELYEDVGWSAYTKDPLRLEKAFDNSLFVLSAWIDDELVGLIRVVGDGLTIVYIQDLLVKTAYQNKGSGRELLTIILAKYEDVRQILLLTDSAASFYESVGFKNVSDYNCVAFMK
ncbi:MAG: GNAT family N-acetyltransferase [Erysipelothrix sp.]|nr:GNAT family N-acetyltransferase [Erysipelothrix sp.]